MGYEASVLYRATRRLEASRRQREEALTRRKAEIYAQLPRLREIDKELKGTVYQIIASSLREGRDPAPSIQVIKDHNLSLQAERTHLLLQNGWGADALDEQPACPKCNDTGWVGAQMCTCLKKLCGEEQIKELSKLLDFSALIKDPQAQHPLLPGQQEEGAVVSVGQKVQDLAALRQGVHRLQLSVGVVAV